ncbi:MAG: hypothetical protein MK231_05075 [Pelagibacterales bacterium]|nr:hypothetical protein [Pelagibacterales bacterium]
MTFESHCIARQQKNGNGIEGNPCIIIRRGVLGSNIRSLPIRYPKSPAQTGASPSPPVRRS